MIGARDLPCQEQISRTNPEESLPSVTSSGLIFYFIFFQILFGQAKIIEYILGVSSIIVHFLQTVIVCDAVGGLKSGVTCELPLQFV